tara:strand:- start:429 stop:599 length:171 start_codon:yes stop_codon:yes gene_type:complete
MTSKEAADYLGITTRTLKKWRQQRRLPFIQLGYNTVRYRETDLIEFLRKNTVKARV